MSTQNGTCVRLYIPIINISKGVGNAVTADDRPAINDVVRAQAPYSAARQGVGDRPPPRYDLFRHLPRMMIGVVLVRCFPQQLLREEQHDCDAR
jgi:hypothetical protein